jgi:uncharacterized membrane protein YbhN (UPF0104 family)
MAGTEEFPAAAQPGRPTRKKLLLTLLKLGLGAAAVYLILQKVEMKRVLFYMGRADWFFLACAFAGFFVSKVFASYRVNRYYRTQGLLLGDWLNVKLNLLAMFYSLFIPFVGGEAYRIWWLRKRYDASVKSLILSSLLDRGSGLAALAALAFVLLQFTGFPFDYKPLLLLVIPALYTAYYYGHAWLFASFRKAWAAVNGYALAVQALQVATAWFILLALGVQEHVMDYLFIFLLACIAYILPFIGAREMAFVFGAEALGLDPELSLAISLFFYLSLAVTSLSGIWFLLFPEQMREGGK